jgi:C-terminal processing protease CtpA/Prc
MSSKRFYFACVVLFIFLVGCTSPAPEITPSPTEPPTDVPTQAPTSVPTEEPATPIVEPTAKPTPEGNLPRAEIVNDEGGPVQITGVLTYTNPFFTWGVAQPVVILEDQAGFVDRDEGFIMPVKSQTLGQITSDFFTSPFSYTVSLPVDPQGTARDVDNDVEQDSGVQIFAIAYWTNAFGDAYLEERDLAGGGWSTAYASTLSSDEADSRREIIGGKLLVYAPDALQGFPTGFGVDELLFTEDDPAVLLPQGYTMVDLDSDPFTFDRARRQMVDLIEPDSVALVDYSDLSYTEAFDALVDQMEDEYAFTDLKGIEWEALRATFRPVFEAADEDEDPELYRLALRDFAWSIPDGHVSGPFLIDEFRFDISGGIGIAVVELDDRRVLVNFLLDGSPADLAGIELGAEILEIDGEPIGEVIDGTIAYNAPFSTDHNLHLDQVRYLTRFPVGTTLDITFRNPGSTAQRTVTLTSVPEFESFSFATEEAVSTGFELPLEYSLLEESGLGYVEIFSFSDNELLTVQLWERMIQTLNDTGVSGLIIDMRLNGGGFGFLADQMAAYFFEKPLVLGNTGYYDEDLDEFFFDPRTENRYYLPSEELRYDGDLVVIVGPNCASACEFFSYDLTIEGRATVIGQYPTAGLGGSIDQVDMPEDESFTFTQGRAVNADGDIHIEGIGVVPDVFVPVNEETAFSDDDPVLQAAIRQLVGEVIDAGEIRIGDVVSSELQPLTRVRYTLRLAAGDALSIILESETSDLDLVLNIFDEAGAFLAGTDPDTVVGFEGLDIDFDLVLVLEVTSPNVTDAGEYTLRIVDES